MPAITVSPGYHGCRLWAAFHAREGSTPSDSPNRSMPVLRPKLKRLIHALKRSMPMSSASL